MPAMTPELFTRLYHPSARQPELVWVPGLRFLAVEGDGDPSSSREFQGGIEAIYSVAYTMKFCFPPGHPVRDARVPPLEGLYWSPGRETLVAGERNRMGWRLMLRLPEGATARMVRAAMAGAHHEIYQSDPRRVKPERYRTVVRYPVRKAGGR
ncbi:MAG: hypothetical protein R6X14_03310 [bacterium]